jgi:hypothetical protein
MIVRVDRCYWQPRDGAHGSCLTSSVAVGAAGTNLLTRWINDHQIVLLPSRPIFGDSATMLCRGKPDSRPSEFGPRLDETVTHAIQGGPMKSEYTLSSPLTAGNEFRLPERRDAARV